MRSLRASGIASLMMLISASAVYLYGGHLQHSLFIIFGLIYGYAIYKSRLCFATAMYGNRELFKGILVSLAIACLASYAIIKSGMNIPPSTPIGPNVLIGSILFGMAMPFAGGCMSGTLFRVGGGQAKSLAALLGILIGNIIGAGILWRYVEPFVDIGRGFNILATIGPDLSLALNLGIVLTLLYFVMNGNRLRDNKGSLAPVNGLIAVPSSIIRLMRGDYWPAWLGGIILAAVFAVQFAFYSTLTIQLPLARSVLWLTAPILPPSDNPWVLRFGLREPYNDPSLLLVVAFVVGAIVASTSSGSFACFSGAKRTDVIIGFIAGITMGVSVWIAVGCNISGFWAAVATLRPEGWLYAIGLFIGARTGLKLLEQLIVARV
ncbi:MAG: YeeE/YedE family protein [Thaumarchaeota archaeon]|nr:YeeE/YedE family protein [Candidatus Calditenuaceae archaeon]